jgi:hypothetical protein
MIGVGAVRVSSLCGFHKKPGALFPAEIIAVRENCFGLRYVALTLKTKNQFLSLIGRVAVSPKTRCPARGEKDLDNEENNVSKQEKDK